MGKYKGLFFNTALFALNAVATKLVTFLLVPLYTYCMSTEEYGLTDMSLVVISLVTPLATLSVADGVMRFIVGDGDRTDEYVLIGFVVTALSIFLVTILSPLLDYGVFGGLGSYKEWFVLAYASNALLQLCGQIARGVGKIRLIPLCACISSAVTCALAVILIGGLNMSVVGYFASVSVGPLAALIVYFAFGKIGNSIIKGGKVLLRNRRSKQYFIELFRPMLHYSLPLIPNSLFWWASTGLNRFFITGMLGISYSGMFAAASKVPNLLNTVYTVFQQAWQLSAFQESKNDNLSLFFSNVFRVLQALMCIFCALLSLIAPWLASILLQGDFYSAWVMIPVLLIANLMSVLNAFYGTVYTVTLNTGYIFKTTVAGGLCCILFTPILITWFGVFGACAALAMSQALVLILRAIDSRKFIAFEAGWIILLPTVAVLVIQASVSAFEVPYWQSISTACFFVVLLIQCVRLTPLVRKTVKRFRQ